jgi:hypothetical protein
MLKPLQIQDLETGGISSSFHPSLSSISSILHDTSLSSDLKPNHLHDPSSILYALSVTQFTLTPFLKLPVSAIRRNRNPKYEIYPGPSVYQYLYSRIPNRYAPSVRPSIRLPEIPFRLIVQT